MNDTPKKDNATLIRLLVVQAQVAFNDNAAKLTLAGLANLVLPANKVADLVGLMAALLVLPFILFSPIFGWMADRFSKTKVLRWTLAFQIFVAALLTIAVVLHQFEIAAAFFFLLALQATAFSPAKQGILKELVGSEGLNLAVSWMESSTIVAILTGGFAGGLLLDGLTKATHDAWHGAALALGILTVACASAWVLFRRTPILPAQSDDPFRLSLLWEHFAYLKRLGQQRPLLGSAAGIAWFYGLGGLLYLTLIQVGRETHPGVGAASYAGWLLTLLGGGIISGALLYAKVSQGKLSLRALPLSAAGMTAMLVLAAVLPMSGAIFQVVLYALGLASGTFIIPLNAFLQDKSESHERGRMLSASNLLTNLAGILAVGAQVLLVDKMQASTKEQFLYLAATASIATIVAAWCQPARALRLLANILARLFYRVRFTGLEHLPATGGILLVCNHVSYVDAFLLGVYFPRPLRFLAFDALFKNAFLGAVLRASGCIPISPQRPKEATVRAIEALRAGEVVCIFPEGGLTQTGEIMEFHRGMELMARKAEVPVIPAYLGDFWGSIFSFAGGKYFWKWPRQLPRRVGVTLGRPLASEVSAEEVREIILALAAAQTKQTGQTL